jgi:hypothetical protein
MRSAVRSALESLKIIQLFRVTDFVAPVRRAENSGHRASVASR